MLQNLLLCQKAAQRDGVIVSFNYQENRKAALPDAWRQHIEALEARVNKPGQGEAVFLTFCSRVV